MRWLDSPLDDRNTYREWKPRVVWQLLPWGFKVHRRISLCRRNDLGGARTRYKQIGQSIWPNGRWPYTHSHMKEAPEPSTRRRMPLAWAPGSTGRGGMTQPADHEVRLRRWPALTVQFLTGQTAQSGGARTGGTSVAPGGDWVRAWRIERAWGIRTVSAASPEGGPARRNLPDPALLARRERQHPLLARPALWAPNCEAPPGAEGLLAAVLLGAVEGCAAGRGTRAQGARDQKIRGAREANRRLIPGRLGEGRQ